MHRASILLVGLAFVFVFVIFTSTPQTAFSQYLPGVYDPYFSWGAYPAMNNAAFSRTVYAEKSAAERQSLAKIQQQQQAQNRFLMNQSRGQEMYASQNTRAASEAWISANQPRQATVYNMPVPSASPAAMPTSLPADNMPIAQTSPQGKPYDQVVDWPSLLKASTFRSPRVRIETIMTKAEPGGPGLSENDYQEVVMSVNLMKNSLERMAAGLNAAEYIGLVKYLDKLTEQAQAAVRK